MICLVLGASTLEQNRADLEACPCGMAELRVDRLDPGQRDACVDFSRWSPVPLILTVRLPADGGAWSDDEKSRGRLLCSLLRNGTFAWVDLEEHAEFPEVEDCALQAGTRIIRSFHDFETVPKNLAERVQAMRRPKDSCVKAAVTPKSTADLRLLVEAALQVEGPKVILGMGEWGVPTRILASRLGSSWTYASPPGPAIAPGQLDAVTLHNLYREPLITPETPVCGVVGNPVLHSKSPWVHNRGYAALKINRCYVPFMVDDLEAFLDLAPRLGINGLSVTVPHKESAARLAGTVDDAVQLAGACNTLYRDGQGQWTGTNTDAEGIAGPLLQMLGRERLDGLTALVIGAGGAARAALLALARLGADIRIVNRSADKALELARRFAKAFPGADIQALSIGNAAEQAGLSAARPDIIVQTSAAGMHPNENLDPLPGYAFSGTELVFEVVYAPRWTRFLLRAREAGCRTITGDKMLLAQAWRQFELFCGQRYPMELRDCELP